MRKFVVSADRRVILGLVVVFLSLGIGLRFSETASSQQKASAKTSAKAVPVKGRLAGFGESAPLHEIPEVLDPAGFAKVRSRFEKGTEEVEEKEKNKKNAELVKIAKPTRMANAVSQFGDDAISPAFPSVVPTPAISFEGLSSADNAASAGGIYAPADTVGDVGPNHYVQMTNTLVRIFNKAGTPLVSPFLLSSITKVAGGPCASVDDGDPIVVYDSLADRWILTQFCVDPVIPGHQVFAVSKTGDPTGGYYVYDFVMPSNDFQDYPHIGVWGDAYYMTSHQFDTNENFAGEGAFAFDRVKMLAGDPTASYIYFNQKNTCPSCGGQLPTDLDGTVPPPPGMGNLFMEFRANEFSDPIDGLRIFEFKPDFATPANSTFTQVGTDLALLAFDGRVPTSTASVIEQPGTSVGLDAIADRLMHRLGYRNLGTAANPVSSWVVNFTVNVGGGNPTNAATYQAGIRWAELRRPTVSGPLTVNQQGTQAKDPGTPGGGTNLWMGSIAQDAAGNIFLGYNTSGSSSATDFPSIKYAARMTTDPPGTLAQGEGVGIEGTGFQNGAKNRWGDYSAASIDPSDECSFWYTNQYRSEANNSAAYNWSTRVIGGIRLPNCTTPQRGSISGNVTLCSTGAPLANAIVTLPGGFLATTNADGQYTIINVPVGQTPASATKSNGYAITNTSGLTVNAGGTTAANFCLTGIPVLKAGSPTIVSESCLPANGRIDPGETVTVALPVSNTGAANSTNDTGTLLIGGGVTAPSAAKTYGTIAAGGGTATQNFTFTADPTMLCGTDITATVTHTDGANSLGKTVFTLPTGQAGTAVTSSYTGAAIAIPDDSPAGVNVTLPVSGINGAIADINFRFDGTEPSSDPASTTVGLNHSYIGDLVFRLTSPSGKTVTIMSAGGGAADCPSNNINQLTLDDEAPNQLACPGAATASGPLTGTFRPSNLLSAFDGENPNGTWTLNVSDEGPADLGSIRAFSLVVTPRVCSTCGPVSSVVEVVGRVVSPTGAGLRNVQIVLIQPDGSRRTVATSALGFYRIENVPRNGIYTLVATSKSYRFANRTFNAAVDDLTSIDFQGLE